MSLLKDLTGNSEWRAIIKNAEDNIPTIPEWATNIPDAHHEWIYKSGMRAGYELAMQIFNPSRKRS